MKAAFFALAAFALFFQASALSAGFVGNKQVTICTCDSAVIPIAITNDGRADASITFDSRGSAGLVTIVDGSAFTVPAGASQVRNIYIAASCDGREGFASIAAKAVDAATGVQATEAGVVKVAECGRLSLTVDKSSFSCGESEYSFTLSNDGLEDEKGTISTNLLDSEHTISGREFSVPAGKEAGIVVRAKVDDASRGKTLVLTATGAHSSASATAGLEKIHCASGNGSSSNANGGASGGTGGNGGASGGTGGNGLSGPLSGFFTLGLSNSLEWLLLVVALLLITFSYYTVRQLETQEAELDKRVLAR